jgi:hypothetical protein
LFSSAMMAGAHHACEGSQDALDIPSRVSRELGS